MSVAFSPDGKHIVSGSRDEMIRIWDAGMGGMAAGPLYGHENSVSSITFSLPNKQIISGSCTKTVHVKNMNKGVMTLFTDEALIGMDGWMTLPDCQLLFWVPSHHRSSLHWPSTVKVLGPQETCLDFSKAVFGVKWASCYTSI